MNVTITKSGREGKKYKAVFTKDGKKIKTTHFGATGYQDYTQHKDKERRKNYRSRHKNIGNKSDPKTAASLSWYILWGDSTSIKTNIADFKKKFRLS